MNVHSNNRRGAEHAPARRGRPIVDDKRRRVLDAALKVFAERGYHGTTMPAVAIAAGVATGTLYHYFQDKEQLVNEVYRDAKLRLRRALLDGVANPAIDQPGAVKLWFLDLWSRLASYARREPEAFRFLEMQDHIEYLDSESRQLEWSAVSPVVKVANQVAAQAGTGTRVDIVIAMVWGAFVGLVKASRIGYLRLEDKDLGEAGATAWLMFAPEATRAIETKQA